MRNAALAAEHYPLVRQIAKIHQVRGIEFNDLCGAAVDGLIAAAQSYKGPLPFREWAWWKMSYAIIDWKRKHGFKGRRTNQKQFKLYQMTFGKRTGEPLFDDPNVDAYEMHGLGFEIRIPQRSMDQPLKPRERYVLEQRYLAERPHSSIAKDLGLSQSGARVSQIERRALPRLRKAYERMGVKKVSDIL